MSTDADTADHPPSVNYVRDVLEAADRPLTQAEIADRTHYARNTVSVALDELVDDGLVVTVDAPAVGDDHTGRPPRRYRLDDGDSDDCQWPALDVRDLTTMPPGDHHPRSPSSLSRPYRP